MAKRFCIYNFLFYSATYSLLISLPKLGFMCPYFGCNCTEKMGSLHEHLWVRCLSLVQKPLMPKWCGQFHICYESDLYPSFYFVPHEKEPIHLLCWGWKNLGRLNFQKEDGPRRGKIRHAKSVRVSTSTLLGSKNQHKKRVNPTIFWFATKQRIYLSNFQDGHLSYDFTKHILPDWIKHLHGFTDWQEKGKSDCSGKNSYWC